MRYPLVLYTNRFLGDWMAGRSIGPLVILRPICRGDAPVLAHEVEHVQQWAVAWLVWAALVALLAPDLPEAMIPGFGLHGLLYLWSRPYRRWCEIAAYAAQLRAQPEHLRDHHLVLYAMHLGKPEYGLGLDFETALAALRHELAAGGQGTARALAPSDLSRGLGCSLQLANRWLPHLEAAMARYAIDTPARMAAFLAQIGHESGRLIHVRELWGPTPAQSRYEGRRDLGNTVAGDGFKYRGRGLIQVTGRANYARVSIALYGDQDRLLSRPELLEQPDAAALSAAWFWDAHGLNALADAGEFERITRRINGGLNGQEEREALHISLQAVLGAGHA